MDIHNPNLEESFIEKIRRIQKEQQMAVRDCIVSDAVEKVKESVLKFVENPVNCMSNECTFGIRELADRTLCLFANGNASEPVATLPTCEMSRLYDKIGDLGFSASASLRDGGHITLRW